MIGTVYSIPLSWIECLETVIESSHCPKGEDRAENRVQERERENAIEKDREQEFGGNG